MPGEKKTKKSPGTVLFDFLQVNKSMRTVPNDLLKVAPFFDRLLTIAKGCTSDPVLLYFRQEVRYAESIYSCLWYKT